MQRSATYSPYEHSGNAFLFVSSSAAVGCSTLFVYIRFFLVFVFLRVPMVAPVVVIVVVVIRISFTRRFPFRMHHRCH